MQISIKTKFLDETGYNERKYLTMDMSCGIMEHKMDYCLGFAFNRDLQNVLLIRKQRPEWQKGLLNGIGGKLEEGETPYEAMMREFQEETGISLGGWVSFGQLRFEGGIVHLFVNQVADLAPLNYNPTDEEIILKNVDNLSGTIPNLSWLVPMAKYSLQKREAFLIDEINLY